MIYDRGQTTGQRTRQFQREGQWSNAFGRRSKPCELNSARKYTVNKRNKVKGQDNILAKVNGQS